MSCLVLHWFYLSGIEAPHVIKKLVVQASGGYTISLVCRAFTKPMNDPFGTVNYKKNFLKQVVARVDLLTPLLGVDVTLPPALGELAVEDFPIPEPRDAFKREVQIQMSVAEVKSQEARFKEWRFHGRERTKTLTISQYAVVVEYSSYQTYELVKREFMRIIDRVGELFPGVKSSRVGLRYVNLIERKEPNPMEWSAYLAPQLLSMFQFPLEGDGPALSRVLHNVELAFEAFNLRYILGMHNPDYPARIRQKVFVLDLDAYATLVVDLREVGRRLDDFHGKIQQYFEHSITAELRKVMNAD
jgi:uncharacterized protein (TIGR04255 family)